MKGTVSKKALQPAYSNDDSLCDQSFTQPDRISIHDINNHYFFLNQAAQFQTPKSNSIISETQENAGIYETESNRSSTLFERSHTHRSFKQGISQTKQSDRNLELQDYIRISSLKNLLRLFRVNLNANSTFEFSGQRYLIDLDDVGSPASRDEIYLQQQPKSMPHTQETFSPLANFDNRADRKVVPPQETTIPDDMDTQSNKQEFDIPLMYSDVQYGKASIVQHQMGQIHIMSPQKNKQDKEIQVDLTSTLELSPQKSVVTQVQESPIKIQNETPEAPQALEQEKEPQSEIDNFYADIARQLALEIEMEEQESNEQEERLKKHREEEEQKRIQAEKAQHQKNKSDTIDKSLFKNTLLRPENDIPPSFKKSANLTGVDVFQRDSMVKDNNPQFRRYMSMGESKGDFRYDRFARLQQVNSEKQRLLELLDQANQKLQSLNQHYIGGDRKVEDAQLHLAFLFASPLVIRQGGGSSKESFNIVPLLEFQKEFSEIRDSIKETGRLLRIKKKQATIENLNLILTQNPLAIHFSGHGIENNKENFGRQHKQRQADGNYLLFETEDGEGEFVSEKMLQEFIQNSNTQLEFVFVASCYSEFAGKIFLNAGAKHVICVKSGQQIADLAVITFSKCFYNSVFSQSMTICDAFKMAQKQVQVKYGLAESNKFFLLKPETHKTSSAPPKSTNKPRLPPGMPDIFDDEEFNIPLGNSADFASNQANSSLHSNTTNDSSGEHKCKIFGPLIKGEVDFMEAQPRFREYPSQVDNFIGRQKEIFDVVHTTFKNRLVTIIGLPGIGKTSLCKNSTHYMSHRRMFKLGIIFMQLKGYLNFDIIIKKLVVGFVMNNFELDEEEMKKVREGGTELLLQMAIQFLKMQEDKLLLVFDNVEDLLYHDKHNFRLFINDLLVECPSVHILMTSRTTMGVLQDISEKILVLQEISPFYTVELFMSRSREIPRDEILELLDCHPDNYLLVGDNKTIKNEKVTNLADHHLFKILGGNPHAIILAAPILIRMKLKELYLLLNSKEMHEVLKVDGIKDSTVASLRLSLEASMKILEREDIEGLSFFFFIGMLPGGVSEEELQELWGEQYRKHLDKLTNLSLISCKDDSDQKQRYILPPFMNNYADAKISQQDRAVFQADICRYYANLCKQVLDTNGKAFKNTTGRQSQLNEQIMNNLLKHENNIWACIYRMVDAPPPQDEPVSEEVLTKDVNQKFRRFSTLRKDTPPMFERSSTQVEVNSLEQTSPLTPMIGKKRVKTLVDQPDTRPFELGIAETPRDHENKGSSFTFPLLDAYHKGSQSVVIPVISEVKGEEDSSEDDDDEDNNEHSPASEDESIEGEYSSPSEYSKTTLSPAKGMLVNNYRPVVKSVLEPSSARQTGNDEMKLDHIIRNSYVNFSRPSQNQGDKIMVLMKNPEIEKKVFERRMTLTRDSHFGQMGGAPNLSINTNSKNMHKSFKTKKRIDELHPAEKLIIYYIMNLYLLNEHDMALHMINNYALKAHGSELYEANIHRILGLIQQNKVEVESSLETFKKAKKLYAMVGSTYGVALCKYSLGYIYRSKINFLQNQDQESIFKRSKSYFQSALTTFEELNHIVGQADCHRWLSTIESKDGNKQPSEKHWQDNLRLLRNFQTYQNKKKCPSIMRVQGPDISLMTEIVTDNDARDMFPPSSNYKKKKSQGVTFQKQDSTFAKPSQQKTFNHQASEPLHDELLSPNSYPILQSQDSMDEMDLISFNRLESLQNLPELKQFVSIMSENIDIGEDSKARMIPISPGLGTTLSTETSNDNGMSELQALLRQKSTNATIVNKLVKMKSNLEVVEEEAEIVREGEESQRSSLIQETHQKKAPSSSQFAEELTTALKRKKSPTASRNKQGLLEEGEKNSMLAKINKSAKRVTMSKSPAHLASKKLTKFA